jgi:hypothetical protein
LSLFSFDSIYAQNITIQQKLNLVQNSLITGGAFVVDYQIKGTNLNNNSTLGTLNADLVYDSTKLRFISGTNWSTQLNDNNGYSTNIQSNSVEQNTNGWVRISVIANNVANSSPAGMNLTSNYITVVRLNFIILNSDNPVSLTIKDITNQIGFFDNNGNNPDTYIIYNQFLSTPENIYNTPLPVELSAFNSNISDRNVNLKWITTFEQNNAGFDIERKISDKNSNWNKIGHIDGKGNKVTETKYNFTDSKLPSGKFNYRLKQIDFNGNYNYFYLKNDIEINLPENYDLSQNYPNPFNPMTKIDYALPFDSKVSMELFDILGRSLRTIVNEQQKAGYYSIQLSASNLSSGTYFYRLNTSTNGKNIIITKKLTVVK